tara:strand:- start:83 stop:709 length:627 start_codon:yes stop_codon:yes gene_type:complete
MGFKITNYQAGIRNARREFTGGTFGVLSGGKKTPNDVIERFIASNRSRFNVQKEMYRDLKAAQLLGVSTANLKKEFKERQLSSDTYNALEKGLFRPYFPSQDIQARFEEIARNIGQTNPFVFALPTLQRLRLDFNNLRLDFNFDNFINPGDFLLRDAPAPTAAPQLPQTGAVITPPPRADVIPQSGLTATETALLSPDEQIIRQRNRT